VELALNTIHQGDCIEGLRRLGAGTINLAFADPPFNIGYEYDVYKDRREYQNYLRWTGEWMAEVCRVLKDTGTFWVAIGDEYAAELKLIGQNDLGLTCRSWIIWYYTFGVNCTKKFSRSHAHLFHFVKDPKRFTFNDREIRVPSARQLVYADSRANPKGRLPDDTWILRPQDVVDGFAPDEDTWYFPRVAGTFKERAGFHGCQMPEQLLGRIIRSCSNPNDIVLDPFVGSGTTLTVARKLGRRWLGFELSKEYAAQALTRVNRAYEGQPLEGSPEPLRSAPRTPIRPTGNDPDPRPRRPSATGDVEPPGNPGAAGTALDSTARGAIIEAFRAASQGFSSDRVIADPALNANFVERCRKFGIPGSPVEWNRALMRYRKAGRLAKLSASRRTTFSREELDCYIFASEIAMRRLLDEGHLSLDDMLCEPELADRFDGIARSFAPGFSSLQYRWAALTIRKHAHIQRECSRELAADLARRRFQTFRPLAELEFDRVTTTPGVYLVRAKPEQYLYAGETFDLGKRLRQKLEAYQEWQTISADIEVGVILLDGIEPKDRCGLQSRYISKYAPSMNFLELGVA
jgi:site-specific DNA-methyltransferase (adenine-specific)